MEIPKEFFTETSISTFGGATLAVFLVTIAGRRLFRITSHLLPFVASLAITFVLASHDGRLSNSIGWLLAVINALLLFCAVTGMNETVAAGVTGIPSKGLKPQGKKPVRLFQSMFER